MNLSKLNPTRRGMIGLLTGILVILVAVIPAQGPTAKPYQIGGTSPGQPSHVLFTVDSYQGNVDSERLENPTPVPDGLGSGIYANSVGGVAFDQVARPKPGTTVVNIELNYRPRTDDGTRVWATVNGRSYPLLNFPDWQLVPIARFADSPYFAAVTFFGKLTKNRPTPNGYHVVSYHPALKNTHLGLRIFQSDFLLMDPNVAGELPRIYDGPYLLKTGESKPKPQRFWEPYAIKINRLLFQGERFQSYVICDFGQQPKFSVRTSQPRQLELTGYPYFFFWKAGNPVVEVTRDKNGRLVRVQTREVVPLPQLSLAVSSKTTDFGFMNAAVYNSLLSIQRHAAFFRYCKQMNPQNWHEFLAAVNKIPSKVYETPTPILFKKLR